MVNPPKKMVIDGKAVAAVFEQWKSLNPEVTITNLGPGSFSVWILIGTGVNQYMPVFLSLLPQGGVYKIPEMPIWQQMLLQTTNDWLFLGAKYYLRIEKGVASAQIYSQRGYQEVWYEYPAFWPEFGTSPKRPYLLSKSSDLIGPDQSKNCKIGETTHFDSLTAIVDYYPQLTIERFKYN